MSVRPPTDEELQRGLDAMGIKNDDPENLKNNLRATLAGVWAAADASLSGRELSIFKTKLEEASMWVERCVER